MKRSFWLGSLIITLNCLMIAGSLPSPQFQQNEQAPAAVLGGVSLAPPATSASHSRAMPKGQVCE